MAYYSFSYSFPYIFFFVFLFLMSINFSNTYDLEIKKSVNSLFFYTLYFSFIFFIGFRGFIYTDWGKYYDVFMKTPSFFSDKTIKENFFINYKEWNKGYVYFTMFFKTFLPNYFLFQAISFYIDFVILFNFFKRYLNNIHLIIMAFAFFFLFNGVLGFGIEVNLMRNAKSIMCFLLSIRFIENRKFLPFLLLNLLGYLFHTTALIFLPLYFILRNKISKKVILVLFVIGNLFYLLQIQWLKELLRFINTTVHSPFFDLIEVYLRMEKYSGAWGLSIGYLERTFSFFLIYFFQDKLIKYNDKNQILINSFYIFIFIYLFCSEMSIILNRVGLLFSFGYWVIYPQIYYLLSNKKKIYFLIIFLFYGILKCSACDNVLFWYENALLPHKSYEQRYPIMNEFNRYIDSK